MQLYNEKKVVKAMALLQEWHKIAYNENANQGEYMLNSHRVLLDPPFSYYKLLIEKGVKII